MALRIFGRSGNAKQEFCVDLSMRLTLSTFVCLFLFTGSLKGQELEYIDIANVKASVNFLGVAFQNSGFGFEVPKGSGDHSIYSTNIWIGGQSNGTTYLSANTFLYSEGNFDHIFGPLADDYTSPEFIAKYRRVWKVNRTQLIAHEDSLGLPGYEIPEVILNWPAHGDTTNGEAFYLAPFVDVNEDGIYNPELGDYPEIRGSQTIYCIFNDDTPNRGPGEPLGVEFHLRVFAFGYLPGAFQNTVFCNYVIHNRSDRAYENLYLGNWTDFDLGDPDDDLIGSDTSFAMFYNYNGDDYDRDYEDELPAIGAIYLNNDLNGFLYHNRDSSVTGDPYTGEDYYNYLTSRWKDGSPMTYGGTGHNSSGTLTRYMFSGDPVAEEGWNEVSMGNAPADRRGLGSVGPFSFGPGQTICSDMAYSWARGIEGQGAAGGVVALRKNAATIRAFYKDYGYDCDKIEVEITDFLVLNPEICQSEEVQIHNISEVDPVTCTWSFPGGVPSTYVGLSPPGIRYDIPGTYGVSCNCEFPSGTERSREYADIITVDFGTPPTWNPSLSQLGFCDGDSISFSSGLNPTSTLDSFFVRVNNVPVDTFHTGFTIVNTDVNNGDEIEVSMKAGGSCLFPRTTNPLAITMLKGNTPDSAKLIFLDSNLYALPNDPVYKYNWYFEDSPLFTNVAFDSITPQDSGLYFADIFDPTYFCSQRTDSILFNGLVIGLEEIDLSGLKEGSILPNPSQHPQLLPEPRNIRIVSTDGKSSTAVSQVSELSTIPQGKYVIFWEDEQGQLYYGTWLNF